MQAYKAEMIIARNCCTQITDKTGNAEIPYMKEVKVTFSSVTPMFLQHVLYYTV